MVVMNGGRTERQVSGSRSSDNVAISVPEVQGQRHAAALPPAPPTNTGGLPGLLRLTPDTRRLIYQHAGVAFQNYYGTPCPAVYNLSDPSSFLHSRTKHEIEEGFQTFHGLLLCCRIVYAEASALLYSANWFLVHYQPQRTLAPLQALTPHALAHLTYLKVVLNQTTCHHAKSGCDDWGECCGADHKFKSTPCCRPRWHIEKHDFPLDPSSALSKALLAEWHAIAAYLTSHIVPGQLELSLVCDVQHDNPEAARLVVDGLPLLPSLKNCHIRLCGTREPVLQQLAEAAVLQGRAITASEPAAVAPPSSLRRPHLANLPRELRLRILNYTYLVTPWMEVIWSRKSGGYRIERFRCDLLIGSSVCPSDFHHGCQFDQCWETTRPEPSVGCFCRQRHTAFSSRCKCWRPPTPLFLVCRALHSDASLVLYSKNRFIVIDDGDFPIAPNCPGDYPHKYFAASQFLRHVVPRHCLGHLRFLELVFTPINHLNRPSDGHPALQDWSKTLDWAREELNLPALTLRLVVASDSPPTTESREMTRAQGKEVLAVYNAILHPLRSLATAPDGTLARFYAKLAWPLKYSEEVVWSRELVDSKERELKRRAEQYVKGERYERACVSTREPHNSVWTYSSHQLY